MGGVKRDGMKERWLSGGMEVVVEPVEGGEERERRAE